MDRASRSAFGSAPTTRDQRLLVAEQPAGMTMVTAYISTAAGSATAISPSEIDYPAVAAPRETDYFYDWRDRLVATKSA